MTDIHDAWTSLEAHGKELPAGLTADIKDKVNRLVGQIMLGQAGGGGGDMRAAAAACTADLRVMDCLWASSRCGGLDSQCWLVCGSSYSKEGSHRQLCSGSHSLYIRSSLATWRVLAVHLQAHASV